MANESRYAPLITISEAAKTLDSLCFVNTRQGDYSCRKYSLDFRRSLGDTLIRLNTTGRNPYPLYRIHVYGRYGCKPKCGDYAHSSYPIGGFIQCDFSALAIGCLETAYKYKKEHII